MKKSYCIAILMLIISVLASNACAISETEGATAEDGQNADQVAANQAATYQVPSPSTIALSLYVLERKGNGIPLS